MARRRTRRFVLLRLAQSLVALVAIVLVVFLLVRLSGNPAEVLAPPSASKADIDALAAQLGLNDPLPTQFLRYLIQLLRGDLGQSFVFNAPVAELILQALPKSAVLGATAFAFASILGVFLGTVSAIKSGTWIDRVARGIALIGQSVPSFWLGMILILVFAVKLQLFPVFGSGGVANLVLPALSLGAYPLAAITRLTRSSTLDVLRSEFTLFERGKGVSERVFLTHVVRNAALPVVTLSGIQLGHLLSGAVVVETLFAYPGLGRLAIQGIEQRDYNVVQGTVLVGAAIFLLLTLMVDLSYAWLDPRLRS